MLRIVEIDLVQVPEPEPGTASVLEVEPTPAADGFVFIIGDGDIDFNCPNCHRRLLQGIQPKQVIQVVFKCPWCDTFSRTRP